MEILNDFPVGELCLFYLAKSEKESLLAACASLHFFPLAMKIFRGGAAVFDYDAPRSTFDQKGQSSLDNSHFSVVVLVNSALFYLAKSCHVSMIATPISGGLCQKRYFGV